MKSFLAQVCTRLIVAMSAALLLQPFCLAQAGLPDAPQQQGALRGLVTDPSGAAVPEAVVTLSGVENRSARSARSDSGGVFSFPLLSAGDYRLDVTASGFEPFTLESVHLSAGAALELAPVKLQVATANAEVQVNVSEQQLAIEQVRAAEKQRVFAIFPNFYTSYLPNAVALHPRQKYSLALHSLFDPVAFAGAAVTAEIEQQNNTFPGYGMDAAAYGKRFGAAFADQADARILGSAVLPSLLHQDPRYFYRGTGSYKSRVGYAVKKAFLCRGDDGRQQINYSYIGGDFAAAGLANVYRAGSDRSAGLTVRNGFVILAGHVATNIVRELISKQITTNLPAAAKIP